MSAVVDFVSDAIDAVGDAVSGVVDAVGDVGQGIIDAASDAVDYVAENPLLLVAAVAAPFALEALAFDAAVGTTALGGYDLAMADAAASLSGSTAAAAAGAAGLTGYDAAMADAAGSLAAGDAAAAGTTGLTGYDAAIADTASSFPATAESLAAADAAAGLIPEAASNEFLQGYSNLKDFFTDSLTNAFSGPSLNTALDTALEVPSAQEAVQVGQQALESTGTSLQVADPYQVFGAPGQADPLAEIVNSSEASLTPEDLNALTEESPTISKELQGYDAAMNNAASSVNQRIGLEGYDAAMADAAASVASPADVSAAMAGATGAASSAGAASGPSVIGPAPEGYDLMGRPINDTLRSGLSNLASAYMENPLALLGTAYGVYSGVNLLDQVLSGSGNQGAANNSSSDVSNTTGISEPVKGGPVQNIGLKDLYDYAALSRDAKASEAIKQQSPAYANMQFRDLLAPSERKQLNTNYVTLEDIQKLMKG